ncbi:MAG: tetratricopeptide repeat protein [bacterium]|nr:MAG: tetratricopeptide repeat protein [bacterium]
MIPSILYRRRLFAILVAAILTIVVFSAAPAGARSVAFPISQAHAARPITEAEAAVVPSSQAHAADMTEQEVRQHLTDGMDYFRRAVTLDQLDPRGADEYYRRSILHFERIVKDGGVRNGKLYYNIGNTYFRLGDIGRAILNYKRAALYSPNDPNLRQNLEFARSRRADKVEATQREKVFKTLFFIHYDIPSRIRFMIFTAAFALVWICAILFLFLHGSGIRLILVIAAVVSTIFLTSLVVEAVSLSRHPEGVIVADEVVARKGDAETYQPSFTEPLHSGTEFSLVERRDGWWQIELQSGARSWIPSNAGELVIE